jgi:hypothetical protein
MPARKRLSKILKCDLPTGHRDRIEELRGIAGGLPFHERYVNGEFREVWAELHALGDELRYDPVAIDALAVSYETMYRAAANVTMIVNRLEAVGYQFSNTAFSPYWRTSTADVGMMDMFEQRMGEMTQMVRELGPVELPPELVAHRQQNMVREETRASAARERRKGIVRPHMPPEPMTDLRIKRVVKLAGEIPFSLRAWHETVGGVNLVGSQAFPRYHCGYEAVACGFLLRRMDQGLTQSPLWRL